MAKITDPSKLLPSTKSTTIAKVGKSNVLTKTTALSKGLSVTRQSKDIININNKLIKVDKFLKSDLIVSQKKAEVERKDKEKEDFAEAEKKLETPKTRGLKLPGISSPSLGFMDRVKRFIFFTALGWALPKILEFLPKLQGFANIIGGVYNFAEGLFGKLFDGFISLVKFGGDLKDKTLGFIATAKAGVGGDYQKEFDKLEKQFNTFVNASIIAGVLATDIGGAAVDEYNKWRKKNKDTRGVGTSGGKIAGKIALRDVGKELGERKPGYKDPGRYRSKGQARAGGFALEKARKKAPTPKPASWLQKITGGLKSKVGKLAKPFGKFAAAAVPGFGAAVGFADSSARSKSGDKLGAFLAGLSASLDVFTAAVAIAGLGSAATGVGIPLAGVLGTAAAAAGVISMSIDVVLLIRDILKAFDVPMFNKGGKIVRRYQSGGTAGGGKFIGTPARRSITPTKRKPIEVQPTKSQPGKDVGGEKVIKEFYYKKSDPYQRPTGGWLSTFNPYTGKVEDKNAERPYTILTTTAKILKDIPLVGGIMGAAVDVVLGQKPDIKVYRSLSAGIGYLVENLANQKTTQNVTSLMKDIKGFAEGGNVPASRELKGNYESLSSGDVIAKILGPTIDKRVNEAIQNIEKQLREKRGGASEQPPGPDDTPGARLRDGSNVKIEADLLEYYTSLYGKNGAIGIVANLRRESGYRVATPDNSSYEGMAQWDRNDRWPKFVKWAENKGLNPYDRNAQAQYVAVELKQLGTDKRIAQAKTPEEAASIFYNEFERGAHSKPVKGNRYNPDNPHENKNKAFIQDISGRNPNIGKRIGEVVIKPLTPSGQYTVNATGTKLSGDLGDFMKSWGGVPGSIWQHSRHGGQGYRDYPSYHNVDRAIDLGAYANEQGPILKKIEEFNRLKGVKPVQLLHAGNDPTGEHNDHVHVAYQGGGLIGPSKPNRPIPNSFASYETYGSEMMIAIQPVIIEKQVPVSGGGNKMIAFPVPVAVNSNMDNLSFSRG